MASWVSTSCSTPPPWLRYPRTALIFFFNFLILLLYLPSAGEGYGHETLHPIVCDVEPGIQGFVHVWHWTNWATSLAIYVVLMQFVLLFFLSLSNTVLCPSHLLFCFVLFCFVLFCFVLFCFGLVWFGLVWFGLVFYHNCSVVQLEVRDGDSTRI